MKKYLMAIDAGTGSIRALLFDLEGHQIACAQSEWSHSEDPRWPGSMDFDWQHNWHLACNCIQNAIKEACIRPCEIAAISTTCMREGIVLYDHSGTELWACANVDSRAAGEVESLIQKDASLEKELYRISGQSFALDALPRLLWIKNNLPEIYTQTASVGMFNDWLIYKLTGKLAVEPSNGSTTGIINLKTRRWEPQILKRCGLRDDLLPPIAESGSIIGTVTEKSSAITGLITGTPVVSGGGDAQLGCIGTGVIASGEAAIFGGSFWQYELNTDKVVTDPAYRVRVNCHAVPGIWQYEALAFKPGLTMRWYRDAFCQHEKELALEKNCSPYDLMNEKAAKIPAGSYGLMCAFSDIMNFTAWQHAAPTFTNFDLDAEKFNRYTFYRAILENTAFVTKGNIELVKEFTGILPEQITFAGGAAKSPLWCQILSDVIGIKLRVPVVKEATGLGAAVLATVGIGIYPNITDAVSRLVRWEKTYLPNPQNHKLYQHLYQKWQKIYAAQLNLSKQNITKSLWTAPGLKK